MSGSDYMNISTENTSCSPYDSFSYSVVAAVSAGLASVSILLILCVLSIFVLFKKWRFFSQRLVLYLAISALLLNVGIILHRVDYHNQTNRFYSVFCEFGGFFDQVTNWMVLISITSIITYCSCIVFFNKNTERVEWVYILCIFLLPFLISWVPFIHNSYGRAGAWCWIRSEERETCEPFLLGSWLQLLTWFVPLYILMIILIVVYVMILGKIYWVKRRLTNSTNITKRVTMKKDLLPLIAYPMIYFVLNIFPLVNRIYNTTHKQPSLALWYLSALASSSVGVCLVLAFTLDPATRKRLTIARLWASALELCGRGRRGSVQEYTVEEKSSSMQSDSYHSTTSIHSGPYRSYEQCYKLNLSSNRTL